MTPLDQALKDLHDDPENVEKRHEYYNLFLQTRYFVPAFDQDQGDIHKGEGTLDNPEEALPLVMEAEGNRYLLLFDSQERVDAWAGQAVKCLLVPGFVAVTMAAEGLRLALNVGTDCSKEFVPEEVAWLKAVVDRSRAASQE